MIDISQIALLTSIIVGGIQVFSYFRASQDRKDSKAAVYAKADLVKTDLDSVRSSIDAKINHISWLVEGQAVKINDNNALINNNDKDIAVMKEYLRNEKESIEKIDIKLDRILNRGQNEQ